MGRDLKEERLVSALTGAGAKLGEATRIAVQIRDGGDPPVRAAWWTRQVIEAARALRPSLPPGLRVSVMFDAGTCDDPRDAKIRARSYDENAKLLKRLGRDKEAAENAAIATAWRGWKPAPRTRGR